CSNRDVVVMTIRSLKYVQIAADLTAVRDYAVKLPAASGKFASIGFCWGGGTSFIYATAEPRLSAAVVYYGTSPSNAADYERIKAPVQGHYGGNDARVDATIPTAKENMSKLNKTYEPHVYEGAGHGFLRAQSQNEANAKAAKEAWPATIAFLKEHPK